MTDVPAIRATVPVAISPQVAAGQATTANVVAVLTGGTIPSAIAQLGVGAVVTGVVVERGQRGQVTIRTDKGSITLQTPLALRLGANVTLQIQSLGAQSHAMILSVDGQPLATQIAAMPPAMTKAPTAGPGPSAAVVTKDAPHGETSQKLSVSPSASAPAMSVGLRPGAVLTGTLETFETPENSQQTAVSRHEISVGKAGETVEVRVLGVVSQRTPGPAAMTRDAPPLRAAAEIPAAEDAVTFHAAIIAPAEDDPRGITLLRTPFGLLRLPVPAQEPPGSQVLLELLTPRAGRPAQGEQTNHALAASRQMMSIGQEWPALRDAIQTLGAESPAIAQQTVATAIPHVGPTLAAGLLFFIAALRSGNLQQWLGDPAAQSLTRNGHAPLLNRLADDTANLARMADPQPNGWQTLLIPLFDGERLRQIRMSLRRSQKNDKNGRKDGARFIIDAELSKLGPLQLDGLVRLPQFDLAIRSRDNLPPEVRADIAEIFNDALQTTKLQGSVVFQVAREIRPGPFENWQAAGFGLTV